eukprot:7390301-Prymnesium_polylepis.1
MILKTRMTPGQSLMTLNVGRNRHFSFRALRDARDIKRSPNVNNIAIINIATLECEGALRRGCKKGKRFSRASSDAVATDLRTARRR